MAGKTAVLLDTCVIGSHVTLDDILKDKSKDYFVTSAVMGELKKWESRTRKIYDQKIKCIDDKISAVELPDGLKAIIELVEVHEKIHEPQLKHNMYIAKMVYHALKKGLNLDISTLAKKDKKYFADIGKNYGQIFEEYGLKVVVDGRSFILSKQKSKKPKLTCKLRKKDWKSVFRKHYVDPHILRQSLETEKLAIKDEYAPFLRAMEVRDYFRLNPQRVISHDTEGIFRGFGESTYKRIIGDISGKRISEEDIESKINELGCALTTDFAGKGREYDKLIRDSLCQARRYLHNLVNHNGGYVPCSNTRVDENLVSAAFNFPDKSYSSVEIMTADTDVKLIYTMAVLHDLSPDVPVSLTFKEQNK